MLAPTPYKTATELGITENEHLLLSMFVSDARRAKDGKFLGGRHRFHMQGFLCHDPHGCGTVGCIAGTMDVMAKELGLKLPMGKYPWYGAHGVSPTLGALFYAFGHPRVKNEILAGVTLPEAAACTEHFLRTGTVDWPLAVEVCK